MKLPFLQVHEMVDVQRNFETIGLLFPSASGAPLASFGQNGQWAFAGDGHIYFKASGTWGLVI